MTTTGNSPEIERQSATRTLAEKLRGMRIVPVIVIADESRAAPLASALSDGGLPCAEVTFRTAAAAAALRRMREARPDMLLGAGTILTTKQAEDAIEAGADFLVSPGSNPRVIDYCLARSIPIFPGVCTPTEIEAALEKGLEYLKFFPAEPMGGVRYLSAVASPYPMVSFMPTGGVGPGNLGSYLALRNVLACGGSWMATTAWIDSGDFTRIRDEVVQAVRLAGERV